MVHVNVSISANLRAEVQAEDGIRDEPAAVGSQEFAGDQLNLRIVRHAHGFTALPVPGRNDMHRVNSWHLSWT